MSKIVIQASNLGKQYRIGGPKARYKTLRESIINGFSRAGNKRNRSSKLSTIWALKDISFEVEQGDVVGIIGANGAGKTTLLKILSRITTPTKGEVKLKGRVGSLLEVGTGFHPELTGRENIYLNGAILGMGKTEIEKKFDEIVAFAEIEKFLDTPVKRYSTGMGTRLAFAIAAQLDPEILLVDEVLAVGDAKFQKKCLGKMEDISKTGRTVIFVSHNMQAIKSLCTKSILLQSGEMLYSGNTNTAIYKYLETAESDRYHQEWYNPAEAPGNESVRLKKIQLIPQYQNSDKRLTVKTPFNLEFEFWSFLKDVQLNITLFLNSIGGEIVFNISSNAPRLKNGIVKALCEIPGSLLNDGYYSISIGIIKDQGIGVFFYRDALKFEVQDERDETTWYGKWPGAVRPTAIPFFIGMK